MQHHPHVRPSAPRPPEFRRLNNVGESSPTLQRFLAERQEHNSQSKHHQWDAAESQKPRRPIHNNRHQASLAPPCTPRTDNVGLGRSPKLPTRSSPSAKSPADRRWSVPIRMAGHKKSDASAVPPVIAVHVMELAHITVKAGQPTRLTVEQRDKQGRVLCWS